MPPRVKLDAAAGLRRSTRSRTKRSAASESDEVEPPAQQVRKRKTATTQQEADDDDQRPGRLKGRKGKAAPKVAQQQQEDSSSQAASEHTKARKQEASSTVNSGDTKQKHVARASVTASAQLNQQPSASAAALKSHAGLSDSHPQAAADPACPRAHTTVVAGNADVMLNQTNIGANNNKFYRMQLLQESPSDHWLWTRWGRVGDKGQTQLQGPFDIDTGLKEFRKKFK